MGVHAPMLHGIGPGWYGSWSAWRGERERKYRSPERQAHLDGWATEAKYRTMAEGRSSRHYSRITHSPGGGVEESFYYPGTPAGDLIADGIREGQITWPPERYDRDFDWEAGRYHREYE